MLKLIDLIKLCGVSLGDYKIHCATGIETSPLDAFRSGKFQEWQEAQTRKNFNCEHVLSLIALDRDTWLFAGIWKVLDVRPEGSGFRYKTKEITGLDSLTGKAVILFKKDFRASYLVGTKYGNDLLVQELLRERHSVPDFPGFSRMKLDFNQLSNIVKNNPPSWKSTLSSVAGVYVIADKKTGKLYVGSAYGTDGIWGRWSEYVQTLHGNDKELIDLLNTEGNERAAHFQFSIIEICSILSLKDEILMREQYWKEALLTRPFGYNLN